MGTRGPLDHPLNPALCKTKALRHVTGLVPMYAVFYTSMRSCRCTPFSCRVRRQHNSLLCTLCTRTYNVLCQRTERKFTEVKRKQIDDDATVCPSTPVKIIYILFRFAILFTATHLGPFGNMLCTFLYICCTILYGCTIRFLHILLAT